MRLGSFKNGSVIKIKHCVLPILIGLLRENSIINQSIKLDTMC